MSTALPEVLPEALARTKPAQPRKLRIAWYRTGEMLGFGGGERVLLEGLKCLDDLGADARLLLNEPASTETGSYFAKHHVGYVAG